MDPSRHGKHKIGLMQPVAVDLPGLDFLPHMADDRNAGSLCRAQNLRHPPDVVDMEHRGFRRQDHLSKTPYGRSTLRIGKKLSPWRHRGMPGVNAERM